MVFGQKDITVIIPYDRDRGWLEEAVASVPTDIAKLVLSPGPGYSWPANFNRALNCAQERFVKFLHEDDKIVPGSLELCLQAFESHVFKNVGILHGNAVESTEGREQLWVPSVKVPTLHDLLKKNTIHSTTLLYRKAVFTTVGLMNESPDVKSFEEYEFNLRCLSAGVGIGYVNATLGWYRRHPQQIIRTVDVLSRRMNRAKLLKRYGV